jgi:beta-lactamase regulating signal transducer with metallopeptidase domain
VSILLFVSTFLKSILCAGLTLLALRLLNGRSASERSRIAHAGLLIVLLLPIMTVALPGIELPTPKTVTWLQSRSELSATRPGDFSPSLPGDGISAEPPSAGPLEVSLETVVAGILLAPAAALLLLTAFAVLRLQRLRSRSRVLLDPRWLAALAATQSRFGFKHGTALLASSELSSPISWGILRPVILLDERAAADGSEAEAIIAHELAHVARLDWAKLILGRATTAVFWFNPLVWSLARRCHELREEAADDAVLRSDFDRADYAQLLVTVARHDQRGALLAANGVAPAPGSLGRRVSRVLDPNRPRSPAGFAWSLLYVGAMLGMGTLVASVEAAAEPDSPAIGASFRPAPAPRKAAVIGFRRPGPEETRLARSGPGPVQPGRSAPAAALPEEASSAVGRRNPPKAPALLEYTSAEVRGRVARALGEAGALDQAQAIAGLLRDSNPTVRLQAAHALGDLQDPATETALREALDDPDPAVRAKAGWALGQVREARKILERFGGG